jgi:hypothetical protein
MQHDIVGPRRRRPAGAGKYTSVRFAIGAVDNTSNSIRDIETTTSANSDYRQPSQMRSFIMQFICNSELSYRVLRRVRCKTVFSSRAPQPPEKSENSRCRTLVARSGGFQRHKSQDQMRHVSSVLTCCSMGVRFDKSDLVRNPVGSGGKRGPSVCVRVSAKRQKAPTVLPPETEGWLSLPATDQT